MATFRRFRPDDLNKFSKCNLDILVETYETRFYLEYYVKWPSLFQVCEDTSGNIIAYGTKDILLLHTLHQPLIALVVNYSMLTFMATVMGKVESSPDVYKLSEHYLPWHAHITAFTVAPEARRMGIGKILMDQVETASDASNAWFVDLFVRRSNEIAIAFYKNAGYSVFRVVKDYYFDHATDPTKDTEDALDMRKALKRDTNFQHIRKDGEKHEVSRDDVW